MSGYADAAFHPQFVADRINASRERSGRASDQSPLIQPSHEVPDDVGRTIIDSKVTEADRKRLKPLRVILSTNLTSDVPRFGIAREAAGRPGKPAGN